MYFTSSGAINYTLEDLVSHYSVPMWYEPLRMELPNGGYTVWSPTAPASGPLISFIMRVLDGTQLTSKVLLLQ
jgi:hypothetical protein